jgi:hypothetical protein
MKFPFFFAKNVLQTCDLAEKNEAQKIYKNVVEKSGSRMSDFF